MVLKNFNKGYLNQYCKHLLIFSFILCIFFIGYSNTYAENMEPNYGLLFKSHGSVMLILDANTGRILDANQAALEFYGYKQEELFEMAIQDINTLTTDEVNAEMKVAKEEKREMLYSIIHDITPRIEIEKRSEQMLLSIYLLVLVAFIILMFFSIKLMKVRKELEKTNLRYKDLFENMESGFAVHEIIYDESGEPTDYRFLEVNSAFEKVTGLKRDNIIGKTVLEVFKDIEPYWIKKYDAVALNRNNLTYENYSKALGKYFSVNAYSPSYGQLATIINDVTDLKNAQNYLEDEREAFKTTLQSLGDAVISTDINGNIDIMNTVAEKLIGFMQEDIRGKNFDDNIHFKDELTGNRFVGYISKVINLGETIVIEDHLLLVISDGREIPIEASAAPIKDSNQLIKGVVVTIKDFTEKREKQKQIEYLSYHDQLTGLYNRRFYEEELERLDTSRNLPFSLAMIDINGLKLTNDVFGHAMGDKLLIRFAEILKEVFREDDIIARIGGDEFVAILPNTDYDEAGQIVKRLYDAISKTRLGSIIISASIGWATKSNSNQEIEKKFKEAEEHMYRKKLLESQSMRNNTVHVILRTLNEKSEIESRHSDRVSEFCKQIGIAMNLGSKIINDFEMIGLIHDIGKIAINEEILKKPISLTDDEFEEIKRHVEIGYQILKSVDSYSTLAKCILYHHERWDGQGYPRGLKMREIPLMSRVIAVADAYEAMTSDRPFRSAMTSENAIEELIENSGTQFDPEIVEIFLELLKENDD